MKQFSTFLLLLVIMIPLAETAHAKDEIITYEQLLAIDEPCMRTPLSKITSTGEIEQRFRLN